MFHGEKDTVVPIDKSRANVEALEKLGGTIRFTTYPDAGHDSWTATYNNPKVYRWMLKHRRTADGVTASAPAASQSATRPARR